MLVITSMLFAGASFAHAQSSPLDVVFTPDPLFDEANFLPGDSESGTVSVSNNSESDQEVQTEAVNISDSDGLSSTLTLTITDNSSNTLYEDTLGTFLRAGEVSLSNISPNEKKPYTFTVTFTNTDDNSYQGKTLGFDICVGFAGEEKSCGTTEISDPDTIDNDEGNGESGSSQSGQTTELRIYNERVTEINNESGEVVIEWDTNRLATSQVIYGNEAGAPFQLDVTDPPSYGYPLYTAEDGSKKRNHHVVLTNVSAGETYVYRVISRASPPTISSERTFAVPASFGHGGHATAPAPSESNGNGTVAGARNSHVSDADEHTNGIVAGTSSQATETDEVANAFSTDSSSLAQAFLSSETSVTCIALGILAVIIALLVALLVRKKTSVTHFGEQSYFWASTLALGAILYFFGILCAVLAPLIAAIASSLLLVFTHSPRSRF